MLVLIYERVIMLIAIVCIFVNYPNRDFASVLGHVMTTLDAHVDVGL